MFHPTALLVISVSVFYSSSALQCTTNCSFSANLKTPFRIPKHCNQSIEAKKCVASVIFRFNLEKYNVYLQADNSSASIDPEDNKRFVLLDYPSYMSSRFSYSIDRACNDQDDCARRLIIDTANEILDRNYNHTAIVAEIQPLISEPMINRYDYELQCYNSNHNVQDCGTSLKKGSCLLINKISQMKISLQCDTNIFGGDVYVLIYDEIHHDYASIHIQCNSSLCNTRSTLHEVKDVLYRFQVTTSPDGRLKD